MAFIQKSGKSVVCLMLKKRMPSVVQRSFSQSLQSLDNYASPVRACSGQSHILLSPSSAHQSIAQKDPRQRLMNTSAILCQENDDDEENEEEGAAQVDIDEKRRFYFTGDRVVNDLDGNVRLPVRYHRVLEIPVEESIRYMQSEAYKNTYGDEPVWKKYRRNNWPGHYFYLTRPACILGGVLYTGSACPICRDDYLVVDYRNVELLKQFISPETGQVYFVKKTCVCRRAQRYLEVAVARAKDTGLLVHDVKIRSYDYKDFYPPELLDPKYRYVEQ